jgi:hypothetical protein
VTEPLTAEPLTIEQQVQYALRAAIEEALEDAALECKVVAILLDSVDSEDDSEAEEETYPAIVINTATPVPVGHQSAIMDMAGSLTVLTYLPDDRRKRALAALAGVVLDVIRSVEDWDDYLPEDATIQATAIVIASGEEPTIAGELLSKATNFTAHFSDKPETQ